MDHGARSVSDSSSAVVQHEGQCVCVAVVNLCVVHAPVSVRVFMLTEAQQG